MSDGKEHLSLVVCGHVDAGKSTTCGHLIFKCGGIPEREMAKLQEKAEEMGKASFGFAYFLDTCKEERERGVCVMPICLLATLLDCNFGGLVSSVPVNITRITENTFTIDTPLLEHGSFHKKRNKHESDYVLLSIFVRLQLRRFGGSFSPHGGPSSPKNLTDDTLTATNHARTEHTSGQQSASMSSRGLVCRSAMDGRGLFFFFFFADDPEQCVCSCTFGCWRNRCIRRIFAGFVVRR